MPRNPTSLRWRITLGLVAFQLLVLAISSVITIAVAFQSAPLGVVASPHLTNAIADSIGRDETGALTIYPDEQLQDLLSSSPDIWAIAQSEAGERVTLGDVPSVMFALSDISSQLKSLTVQGQDGNPEVTALFGRVTTPSGTFAVLSGGGGFLSVFHAILLLGHLAIFVPGISLFILTLVGVPLFINWCLRSLRQLTSEIDRIDFAARGVRLDVNRLPREILPVMSGVNGALQRMDAGFEMTERFFMNAAHELRTPIAILQVRLDAFPPGPEHEKLRDVVRRLTTVVNQLLDIERFRQNPMDMVLVDLRTIVSSAVADLAPYAIAEGYSIELDEPQAPVWVHGDVQSLDRMIFNLIQNAVQHGGGWGTIAVSVLPDGAIDVLDQGPGVPWDRRERIFEPFYRVNPQGAGAGLGLKMVRDIARLHRGEAAVSESSPAGTRFTVRIPTVSPRDMHDGIRDGRFMSIDEPDRAALPTSS